MSRPVLAQLSRALFRDGVVWYGIVLLGNGIVLSSGVLVEFSRVSYRHGNVKLRLVRVLSGLVLSR